MRLVSLDLLALVSIAVIAYVIYRWYLASRVQLTQTAYFNGGPLNGTQQKLAKLPEDFVFVYDKPRLVTFVEGEKPVPVKTWYDAHYDHVGDGVYEYQGDVVHQGAVSL